MKTVKITGTKEAELKEVSDPRIREDFVLVKIYSVPMCTEYKKFAIGQ